MTSLFPMSRRISRWTGVVLCAGLLSTAAASPARAQDFVGIGDQPAATLLLPYFEVDLDNPAGANTLFSINNASASATLAHVTVWSAMHVPVYTFDVYLTGFDMQTINVRDILDGVVPQTASDGQDLSDDASPSSGISNQGIISQDINFASCNGVLPAPPVPQATIDHLRASLTGRPSALAGNVCASRSDGTNVARGYITVDVTNACTSLNPSDAGYFTSGGNGIAGNRNILWGDVTHVNHLASVEAGDSDPLVHIRAFPGTGVGGNMPSLPDTTVAGQYTFYGRLVNWSAADNREPLGTIFATRFSSSAALPVTTLTVWRDAKVDQDYFACGSTPSWYPLGQEGIAIFDEQEGYEATTTFPYAPQPPSVGITSMGMATQRVRVGTDLPTTKTYGWMYLNLNFSSPSGPPEDTAAAQAWVSVRMGGAGRYSAGWHATQLDSARAAWHMTPH